MTAAIGFHVATGTLAIGAGAAVLLSAKGTRWHRWLGWTYVAAMAAMLAGSFVIRPESGGFTLFHGVSIATAVVVALGLAMSVLWRRRVRRWPLWHLRLMSASWLMLVRAAAPPWRGRWRARPAAASVPRQRGRNDRSSRVSLTFVSPVGVDGERGGERGPLREHEREP